MKSYTGAWNYAADPMLRIVTYDLHLVVLLSRRLRCLNSRIQAEGQAFLKSISEDNDIRKRNRNNHKSGYPNKKQNLVQSVTKRHAGLRVNLFRA